MNYAVSIIIPVYNAGKYLNESIKSINKQTLSNIEIICIDDGSDDDSMQILVELSALQENLRIIKQNHKGAGSARNEGIRQAKGEFISFLDADDFFYDADALERMYKACKDNNQNICGSYRKELKGENIYNGSLFLNLPIQDGRGSLVKFEDFQNDFDYQNFIFKREFLVENEIWFPNYLRYQDPPFFLNALILAKEFWVVPVFLYCYRVGNTNYSLIARKMGDVLDGITDTLVIAIENNYYSLYKKIVNRLDNDYLLPIFMGYSDDIEDKLRKIDYINGMYSKRKTIRGIEKLTEYAEEIEIWGSQIASCLVDVNRNPSFFVYRNIALLNSKGKDIGDILIEMGVDSLSVYGYGELGDIFINELNKKVKVLHVFDKSKAGTTTKQGYVIESPDLIDVTRDDLIVVTPANIYQQISWELIKKGVCRTRIIALNTILSLGVDGKEKLKNYRKRKQFLITGAQFHNKGAQTMLFISVDEIKKRFSDAIIWYLPVDDAATYTSNITNKYAFHFLLNGNDLKSQLFEVSTGLTAIVDISGYALSSYWENEWYMNNLRLAYNYKIPLFIMPQSFGPFDFDAKKNFELQRLLANSRIVYAREKQAYELLLSKYNLKNVKTSCDLVLQNKIIQRDRIYCTSDDNDVNNEIEVNSVAIIPNVRLCEFSSSNQVIELFSAIIGEVLKLRKKVYIIPYSDDESLCIKLKECYFQNKNVLLYENSSDCLAFEKIIGSFDFVIAARFHAIVHAYRTNVPALVIGWADKYSELVDNVNQSSYIFDIRQKINIKELLEKIHILSRNINLEKEKIKEAIILQQKENCFDCLNEIKE